MDGPSGDIIEEVVNVADELGKSPAQVSLAWLLSHDEITCGISGADNIEQLEDVLGAVGWDLPVELRERLDAVSDIPGLAIR